MTLWRPPSSQEDRLLRSIRSMNSGTLDGRVASALPVGSASGLISTEDSDSEEEEESAEGAGGITLVPYTDQFRPGEANTVIFNLTYAPYDDPKMGISAARRASVHIYWEGLLQYDLSYSLSGRTLILSDLAGQLRADDIVTIKYWYDPTLPYGIGDVVYLNGPPTHYINHASPYTRYLEFAEMEALAGSAWAGAVSSLVFNNGSITVPDLLVVPDGGLRPFESGYLNIWMPAWVVPTDTLSCRVLIDEASVSPFTLPPITSEPSYVAYGDQFYCNYTSINSSLAYNEEYFLDDFFSQHFFWDEDDPESVGTIFEGWEFHMEKYSDVRTTLPPDGEPGERPENFQVDPMASLSQGEASAPILDYVVFSIEEPVLSWPYEKPVEVQEEYSMSLTGVRVERFR